MFKGKEREGVKREGKGRMQGKRGKGREGTIEWKRKEGVGMEGKTNTLLTFH